MVVAAIHSFHKNNTIAMTTASSPKLNSSLMAARVEAAKEDTNSRTLAMLRDLSLSPLSATNSRGGGSQLLSPLSANTQPTSPVSLNSSQSRAAQLSVLRGMSGELSNTSYFTANSPTQFQQQPLNLSGDYLNSPMSMNSRGSTVAEAAFAAAAVHDQNTRTLALLRAMSGDLSTANSTLSMNSRCPVADAAFAAATSYDRDAKTMARLRAMSGELSTANSMCSDSLSESSLKDAMALGRLYQNKTTTTSPLGSMISHEKNQQTVAHEAAQSKAPTTSPPTSPVPQQPLVEAARRKVAFVERNPTPISRAPSAESEWTKDSKQNNDAKLKAPTNERNSDNTQTGTPNSIMKKTSSPNPHHPIKVPVKTSSSETETLGTQTIVDDESESSLLVLIRYMGCSPNRYGSGGPSLRSRAMMSDQLDKEYIFESYSMQEYDSMLSDAADYSSEIEDIEQSWTLLNDEVGVEINLLDMVLPSPVSTDEKKREEEKGASELYARAASPKMNSAARSPRMGLIAGIPAERLEMSAADLILEAMSSTVTNEAELRALSIISDVASHQAQKVATRSLRTVRKTNLTVDTGEPLRPTTMAGLAALGKYEEAVKSPSKKKSKAKSPVGEAKKKTMKKKSIASPKLALSDSTSELLESADCVIKDRIAKTMANVAALRKLDGDVIPARMAAGLSEPTILISPITKSSKKADVSSPITKPSKPKKKKSSSPTHAKQDVTCSIDKEGSISTGIKKKISPNKTESTGAAQPIESRTESPPLSSRAVETEDIREVDEFLSSTRDWIASNAQERNLALQSPTQSADRLTPKSFARKIVSENSTPSPTNAAEPSAGRKNILEQLDEIRMKQRELEARQATKLNM